MFQNEDSPSGNLHEPPPGVVVIPSVMGNKKLYIGTLLADLCSQVLGEFGRVVCPPIQMREAKYLITIGSSSGNTRWERASKCDALPKAPHQRRYVKCC